MAYISVNEGDVNKSDSYYIVFGGYQPTPGYENVTSSISTEYRSGYFKLSNLLNALARNRLKVKFGRVIEGPKNANVESSKTLVISVYQSRFLFSKVLVAKFNLSR